MRRYLSGLMILCAAGLAQAAAAAGGTQGLDARRQQLTRLIAAEWNYEMRESPEFATIIGDYRYNDRWSDPSLGHVTVQRAALQRWLRAFTAIDTTGFPEQERLNQQLMVRGLTMRIEGIDLKTFEMPVDQTGGVQVAIAEFVSLVPFNTTRQYEDYLARLQRLPAFFDQVIGTMRRGAEDRLMPPTYLLQKTVGQCEAIAAPAGEASPFAEPLRHFPPEMSAAERTRLHDAIVAAIDTDVRPAYRKLANFIATDYARKGRTDAGIWALPNGAALYRFAIRQETTTSLDPEVIHQLGLEEVKRIEAEQLRIAHQLGFADLRSFRESLKTNPQLTPTSAQQLLDAYRHHIEQMQVELPRLFGLLPKTQVEVRPMEKYREQEAAAAEYNQGTPDGSRQGAVMVNVGDYQHRSLTQVEATAYHEGVPGHHMQIAIAQTLPELPPFRQQASYTAYAEGWALYAEGLGKDLGFYQDPYSDFGRLSSELLRAARLVLDTGVHYKHWTREQMVDFFREHTSEDEPDLQSETDRYIVTPAQALAYKIGALDILKLRERARLELGSRYDVRAFHDEILSGGALPLDVLDSRVGAWITTQKNSPHPSDRRLTPSTGGPDNRGPAVER